MKKIIIDPKIFETFPMYRRGIIYVRSLDNHRENEAIATLLENAIAKISGNDILGHEYLTAWDEAYRVFGSKPNKFPPSIKSLLKRIQKGGAIPFINSVVALFNYISMRYLLPCGGDDLDRIEGNLRLGFASGNEHFVALGSDSEENPDTGEVIYYDDSTLNIMCRRWNWRNGDFSKIEAGSKRIVINVDGIGSVPRSHIMDARNELAHLLAQHCGADLETNFLDPGRSVIELSS